MAHSSESITVPTQAQDGPRGIGGWLILPIISLILTVGSTIYNLYDGVKEWEGIKAIIAGANNTAIALRLPVAASSGFALITIGVALACLFSIFTHSPRVPRLMTIFYILAIVATVVEILVDYRVAALTGGSISSEKWGREFTKVVVAAAIWIPYFHRSRRVANTFRTREAVVDRKIGEIF
ncbi:DUF2569 domain-containing protein [Labrys sp. LIt4]|uniref:DUF2569 domain-containing protein n=1 Tax=Labrys sp. LIt4 TaxID=2821355 RepID=UPI001AE02C53|nr:DUF2569 domain-containing protein [Labrys sp. LIt4]MBP0581581.1 DUF2569 domain-containing protein [Labrys sp. LIt4]